MNDFCRAVLNLVAASLTEKKEYIPEDFNWEEALKLADVHRITPMLYYGAQFLGISAPEHIKNELIMATLKSIKKDQKQQYEISLIQKAFEENEIDYVLLKGIDLKPLYPKSEMRSMTDADILIKEQQYDKIYKIMEELEFSEVTQSDHEYIWEKKHCLNLELHKRLIPSYNKDYYEYFSDGWKFAHKKQGSMYCMSDEDNFVYLFTHFAKHYRDAGIGIRYMTDLYLYLKNKPDMDKVYIEKTFETLGILKFYLNIVSTLEVWFEGRETDDVTDFITSRIINSGLHGTYYNHIVSKALKDLKHSSGKGLRAKRLVRILFPSFQNMKILYPCLEKAPVLLVWFWFVRLVSAVLYKRKNVQAHKEAIKIISPENIQHYQDELVFVGLDFGF